MVPYGGVINVRRGGNFFKRIGSRVYDARDKLWNAILKITMRLQSNST